MTVEWSLQLIVNKNFVDYTLTFTYIFQVARTTNILHQNWYHIIFEEKNNDTNVCLKARCKYNEWKSLLSLIWLRECFCIPHLNGSLLSYVVVAVAEFLCLPEKAPLKIWRSLVNLQDSAFELCWCKWEL